MRKFLVLTGVLLMFGFLAPANADTMNYKIKYDGDSMVIVPYYSIPSTPEIQRSIPNFESAPVKSHTIQTKNFQKGKIGLEQSNFSNP